MLMEMLTYEKLRAASDVVPPEVVDTWQPPQAVKALLEFQPLADQTFKLEIGSLPAETPFEKQEWVPLGEHHALELAWLRKNYNKIGNMLHAPSARESQKPRPEKRATYLRGVIDDLEKVLGSGISEFTERGGYTFNCAACGKLIIRSAAAMQAGKTAVCPTPRCDAEYRLVRVEGNTPIVEALAVRFECQACKTPTDLPQRKVALGFQFKCAGCSRQYQVLQVRQNWLIGEVGEAANKTTET